MTGNAWRAKWRIDRSIVRGTGVSRKSSERGKLEKVRRIFHTTPPLSVPNESTKMKRTKRAIAKGTMWAETQR